MADVHLVVDDTGVRHVIEALQLRLQPDALKEFLIAHAHTALRERAAQRFANEGDDVVGKWAELARATGIVRQFLGYSPFHPINVRTGALRDYVLNTFTTRNSGGAGAVLMMPGPASGEMLSKLRVAQQGGSGTGGTTKSGMGRGSASARGGDFFGHGLAGPNRPTPPRPVLAIGPMDGAEIGRRLLEWVRAGIF